MSEQDQIAAEDEVVEIATMMPDQATEESMPVEPQISQLEPTPTEPQATASPTPKPQANEVEPIETQSPDTELMEEAQPTATQTSKPQPTAILAVEAEVTDPQPTETLSAEAEPMEITPVAIRQGQFKDADDVHKGSGTATIYQKADGSYLLRFENFAVCCGPDLYVFLAENAAPTGHADLGNYIELSSLKSSTGNQEYEIPADTDLSQFNSVVIYCKPFQVIISTATFG